MDLFKLNYNLFSNSNIPLAERMRPENLDNFFGQYSILTENSVLKNMIVNDNYTSMIFYGPPGTGKTSIANIISKTNKYFFVKISAITSGIKDVKDIIHSAKDNLSMYNKKTILFIDEIHRFNKSQQDFLLEFIEKGDIIFIGATTENPFYEINKALISRVIVIEFEKLSSDSLKKIINFTLKNDIILKEKNIIIDDNAIDLLIKLSNGDARTILNNLEIITNNIKDNKKIINKDSVVDIFDNVKMYYDKKSTTHHDYISAFIKSMRASNDNAAIYYLAAMLNSGEDIIFISRRMIIFASEDIGNADPNALVIANSCDDAVRKIGMPESRIILAQCAVYLSNAPKSNSSYKAINDAIRYIKENGVEDIPSFLSNSYSFKEKEEYLYPHDYENMVTGQEYMPDKLKNIKFYNPKDVGFESKYIKKKKEE